METQAQCLCLVTWVNLETIWLFRFTIYGHGFYINFETSGNFWTENDYLNITISY